MADQNLNILMRLIDNFTTPMQTAVVSINKAGESLERTGKSINQFGSKMTFLGGAMTGGLILAMNNVKTVSPQVDQALENMTNTAKELELVIATALVPVIQRFTAIISTVVDWFKQLNPHLRDTIIQWTLIGGVVLTVGGVFLKVGGTIISIVGKILASLNPVTITIGAIVAAIILMLQYWDKVRGFVIPVVNGLQIGLDMVAIGALKVVDGILWISEVVATAIDKIADLVSGAAKMKLVPQEWADAWQRSAQSAQDNIDNARSKIQETIGSLEKNMEEAMSGKGWGEALDLTVTNVKANIESLWDGFKNVPIDEVAAKLETFKMNFMEVYSAAYKSAMDLGTQSAQILTQTMTSLSNGIGNSVANMLIYGKNFGESMKQVFMQMAAQFISSVVSMIAQWVIFQAVNAAFLPIIIGEAAAAASAIAALWTVPATLVSIATLGGAAAPALASVATALAGAKAMSAVGMVIPGAAEGGNVVSAGRVLVGERGPEFLDLPVGARVTPLDRGERSIERSTVTNYFSISIEVNNPNMQKSSDIDTLAQQISKIISDETDRMR